MIVSLRLKKSVKRGGDDQIGTTSRELPFTPSRVVGAPIAGHCTSGLHLSQGGDMRREAIGGPGGVQVLLLLLAAGCGPNRTPTDVGPSKRVASTSPPDYRSEFHRRNPQDWAGVLHNVGVQSFLQEFKAGHIRPGHVCEAIAKFTIPPEALPLQARGADTASIRRAILQAMQETACIKRTLTSHTAASASRSLSQEATNLLNDILAAGEEATDANGLAGLLLPILDAADELADPDERAVVQGVAAIGQSSAEYWEQNLSSESQGVGTWVENNCEGLTPDDCIGTNGEWQTSSPLRIRRNRAALHFRLASTALMSCTEPSQAEIFDKDLIAAGGGFLMSLWTGPGSLATAGIAGASVSTATMIVRVVGYWICLLFGAET